MSPAGPPGGEHALARLLCQLAVLLFATRSFAELARRLGQPGVLGELLAGIVLGPGVLGALAPALSHGLFPAADIAHGPLEAVSWLGMVLLLFLIGAETDLGEVRRLGRTALLVSAGGVIVPFASGLLLGLSLPPELVPASTSRGTLAAFLATALSISALPVIAKILRDLGLARRDVGVITLGAALVDDATGWVLLSVVSGMADTAGGSPLGHAARAALAVGGFAIGSRVLLLPVLKRLARFVDDHFTSEGSDIALYAGVALACAAASDALGLHAVFGAFVAGTALRRVPRLRPRALERIEGVVGAVLAPVFFASVGLKVDLGQLERPGIVGIVLAIAVLAKVVGCTLGGKAGGLSFRSALAVGAAMSARGAVELVVAVVGLSRGILSPALYASIVLMAVGTSLIAPILLRLITRGLALAAHERERLAAEGATRFLELRAPRVLVPTAGGPHAHLGVALAASLCRREGARLSVLHVESTRGPKRDISEHLRGLQGLAAERGSTASVRRVVNEDVIDAVVGQARSHDLLLLGASNEARAIYAPLVEGVLRRCACPAAVIFSRPGSTARFGRLVVPVDGSVFARVAVELATAYAAAERAEVVLVAHLPGHGGDIEEGPASERIRAELLGSLGPLLAGAPAGARVEVVGGAIDEPAALLDLLRPDDLLVLGAHKRAVGERLSLGSDVEALVQAAGSSVAVVIPHLTP